MRADRPPLRVGVMASGAGTTLRYLLERQGAGEYQIVVVLSNNSSSGALRVAAAHGVSTVHVSAKTHPDDDERDRAIRDALCAASCEVVVTAGYLKMLGERTRTAFAGRAINLHPSLLPRHGGQGMYGDRVHAAVLTAGDGRSGATVHMVDAGYDDGAIIAQRSVAVASGDTPESLQARISPLEKALLFDVVSAVAGDRSSLPLTSARRWEIQHRLGGS
jgi:phosphoribosylglycinamide formyltransferase 1